MRSERESENFEFWIWWERNNRWLFTKGNLKVWLYIPGVMIWTNPSLHNPCTTRQIHVHNFLGFVCQHTWSLIPLTSFFKFIFLNLFLDNSTCFLPQTNIISSYFFGMSPSWQIFLEIFSNWRKLIQTYHHKDKNTNTKLFWDDFK